MFSFNHHRLHIVHKPYLHYYGYIDVTTLHTTKLSTPAIKGSGLDISGP